MKIPPIHNMVVQWDKGDHAFFFNKFVDCNTYINIDNPDNVIPHKLSYNSYYTDMIKYRPHLYLPVKASTLDELKLEHPELFI